ncbi:hypothetical protein [Burkholderia pseudomallei]|uniref:hypothetical protein n=1 Tax=Burkholderia pseudomallei TaxID=28450 RepID=UPI0008FF2F3F|nr:hypothetical protein [Burkholderia pseudomallei]APD36564.1 hypothetical protein BK015_16430 [Burkholderia pseudomallei]ARK39941.1 hypothetical protein BOC60_06725 [Burkholderia pseudomallei]ARL36076.1 hypothetical protein BOC49_07235 [Burkholderia pseudomallei]ARL58634.1 hypothetical protein BOC52_18725 [Burkholderia pseudomallei]ARL68601.1 hypothetical protein BOC53_36630 [Burkholderia pseudomallei]
MVDSRLLQDATMIAACAADQFANLEALFDAIRQHLDEFTYERSLVDMGRDVASQYGARMRTLSQPEVAHV